MQWYEILIVVCAAAFVIGVITTSIIRKKKGKGGCDECGGACGSCSGCSMCSQTKPTEKKK